MKFRKIPFLLMSALLFTLSVWAQTAGKNELQAERDKRELIRLTNEVSRASVARDAATLERLMDDRFALYGVSDKFYGKAELIKKWTKENSDSICGQTCVPSDFEVHLFGKTAIVISTITDSECEGRNAVQTKAFDVWKKTKKGWRWIASRETLLPAPGYKNTKNN